MTTGKKVIKKLVGIIRTCVFVTLYAIWPIFRKILAPDVIFLVYGTDQDKRMYWPRWAEMYFRHVFPIGIIRYGNIWGLIGATLVTDEDMDKNPSKAIKLLDEAVVEFPHAKKFALAGRLPGFVRRTGRTLDNCFVDGSRGTRFAMLSAAHALTNKLGKKSQQTIIAVPGGSGYIGEQIVRDLADEFLQVIAIDPRYSDRSQTKNIICTSNPSELISADAVLVLTAKGDDVQNLIPYFGKGMQVADDTHPPMHKPIREQLLAQGAVLWKATVSDGRLTMFPRLPNFRRDDIPGCLLETLVVLLQGDNALKSQSDFNEAAKRAGFSARLGKHSDDS